MAKKSLLDYEFCQRRKMALDSDTAVRDKVIDVAGDVAFAHKMIERCKFPGEDTKEKLARRDEFVEKAIQGIQFVLGMDYGLAINEEDFKEYVYHLRDVGDSLEMARKNGYRDSPSYIHMIDPIVYFRLDRKRFEESRRMCGLPNDPDILFGPVQNPNPPAPAEDPPPPKSKVEIVPLLIVDKVSGK